MTALPGPPPNPRLGRQRFLVLYLRTTLVAVAITATATLALPDDVDHVTGWMTVWLLVLVPAGRVAWLAIRWFRLGDRRYAAAATAVLVVMTLGAAAAAL